MEEHNMIRENQEDQDEEKEEALSLCDLPLMGDEDDDNNNSTRKMEMTSTASQTRKSSPEPPEIFEFLSDSSSDMISAEDIIFCGKLIPLKGPNSLPSHVDPVVYNRHFPTFRRRCESLSELQFSVSRSNSAKARGLVRNSRSLDYRKLDRFSGFKKISSESTMERNSSVKSVEKAGEIMALKKAASKPRWFQLLFGVVKPPAWMELRDIKSRQVRMNPTVGLFPHPMDAGGNKKVQVENGSLNKGSCGLLLKVLSCKDPASVAVTTSFCLPQV